MWHSCGGHGIDEHFVGKEPRVREVFDTLVAAVSELGQVHVYAQKTRIVFQARGRFVALTPRQKHLAGHLWLKRRWAHPLFYAVESLQERDFLHKFRLQHPSQVDSGFRELLYQAFLVGSQDRDLHSPAAAAVRPGPTGPPARP
jgi:hypothetical protein